MQLSGAVTIWLQNISILPSNSHILSCVTEGCKAGKQLNHLLGLNAIAHRLIGVDVT